MGWWGNGVMEWWSGGVMEYWWSNGVLEWWSNGVVEWWELTVGNIAFLYDQGVDPVASLLLTFETFNEF